MRKHARICISIMTIAILIITNNIVSFAGVETSTVKLTKDMSNEAIINIAKEHGDLDSNGVVVQKLSAGEKRNFVSLSNDDDFDKVDVYTIERELEAGVFEKTVFAEVDVAKIESENGSRASSEVIENKEGRVCVQSVIGYKPRTFAGVVHYAGTHYGGKVTSQQSGTAVTSIYGTYAEYGVGFDSSGNGINNGAYNKTTYFDLSKHTTLQTASISTGNYYLLNVTGASGITSAYTATYTVRGSGPYTISVIAYAK